jgi:hypothetical protein
MELPRGLCFSVLFNVMSNEFVPEDFKERLKLAARTGRDNHTCLVSAKDQRRHLNGMTTFVWKDDILNVICKFSRLSSATRWWRWKQMTCEVDQRSTELVLLTHIVSYHYVNMQPQHLIVAAFLLCYLRLSTGGHWRRSQIKNRRILLFTAIALNLKPYKYLFVYI